MKTVHKYHIDTDRKQQEIEMPIGAQIKSCGLDLAGKAAIWSVVDTEVDLEKRTFVLLYTGHSFAELEIGEYAFIGTIVSDLVYHLFEVIKN